MPQATTLPDSGEPIQPVLPNLGASKTLAAAGSVQGNAAAITSRVTRVTGADAAKGVILPNTARPGDTYTILNDAAAGLLIYPHLPASGVGGNFGGNTANSHVEIENRTTMIATLCADGLTWAALYTPNA